MSDIDLVIIGAGGHARVVTDAVKESGFHLAGIIDIDYQGGGRQETILGIPVIGDMSALDKFEPGNTAVVIAIGDCAKRAELYTKIKAIGFRLPFIIHPTAIVSKHVDIEGGVFINTGVIINAEVKIRENTIINTAAVIEHEVTIGRHCHLAPGVRIGGRTNINDYVFIGIGSNVINGINIGHNAIIGAGSVIINDVGAATTVVGAPGKMIG